MDRVKSSSEVVFLQNSVPDNFQARDRSQRKILRGSEKAWFSPNLVMYTIQLIVGSGSQLCRGISPEIHPFSGTLNRSRI